jgi:hypothetical protein
MFKITVNPTGNGMFDWVVQGLDAKGHSKVPLLDACRVLKRMGANPGDQISMYYRGRSDWALSTKIGVGAGLKVVENDHKAPYFAAWVPPPQAA